MQTRSTVPKPLMSSRLPDSDQFNISNDKYYSTKITSNQLKVDRRSLLRGLHNAFAAVESQTTRSVLTEEALLSWHHPKIPKDFITEGARVTPSTPAAATKRRQCANCRTDSKNAERTIPLFQKLSLGCAS